ncbi:cation:dicarboxylase symporter family transporter [uncultured Sphingomonas sp.]|uniref:dicarboxylate/amino acid:cation symporter n=1 Tax=uncultured Sphingomonas sp. TaxID=158754 RepID=UPI0025F45498|nr:cation:dicarboxylase symporter family transporter [uncultured Sphingomonas sp.]
MSAASGEGRAKGGPRPFLLLLGLAIGLVGGAVSSGAVRDVVLAVARPVGALWLDALTMTVVPLVFGLLVTGTAGASRSAAAGPVTIRALAWFAIILTVACLVAAFLAEGLLSAWPVVAGTLDAGAAGPLPAAAPSGEWYHSIIPANPIKAAADTAMVPLVVFALLFGFAISRLETASADALLRPTGALVEAMLVLVRWVLRVGPIGVAALAFASAASLGAGIFGTLGQYVVVVSVVCLSATLAAYIWVALAGRESPIAFARAAAPVQAVALGTQSSLASLPVMVEAAARLQIREDTAGIVLPLAVSLFRAASAAANVAVTIYLAHMNGIAPDIGLLVLAALVAVPVSLGAVGLPAQVSFFATIAPVCLAIGVPVTALPLLLAIEALPDLFRTLGNVTNDLAVARIVSRGD